MKKKLGLIFVSLLGFCAISCTTVCVVHASNPQYVAVLAEGEEETSEPMTETSEPAVVEEQEPEKVDEVKEWFDQWFSPAQVAMYMSWLAYIGTMIGLVANIKRLKQTNNLTLKSVSDEVQAKLKIVISEEVAEQFGKIAPKLIAGQEKSNEIMTIFAKILALSQENTPESRVAILNLIEQLGCVGKELVDTAKQVIEDGQKLAEESKKALDNKIDEIVDSYDGTSI